MNKWLGILALCMATGSSAVAANTTARLVLPADTVRSGETILAGVVLEMAPGWHTYWSNPGESGMATEIEWTLPDGVSAGAIQWPVPATYEADALVTYVYHDTAMLLVPVTFSPDLARGPLTLKAEVSWLECELACIPGSAEVQASITVSNDTTPSTDAARITEAKSTLPANGDVLNAKAAWEGPAREDERGLIIEWPATREIDRVEFYPYAGSGYEIGPHTERLPVDSSRVALRAEVKKFKGGWPTEISGLIALKKEEMTEAFEVQLKVATEASMTASGVAMPSTRTAGGHGLAFFLLAALGGGLILNLMPCVLPILSLKILSLVRQGSSSAGERRKHGIVYTLGVLVSFWAIGGLVIAGRLASWGEQFQDPRFIVAVTVLMTLVALNLFGVFEVLLPGSTVTSATQLASKEGSGGAFFNGVLAVILGASCVAPMLAAAVGWAISQPPLIIFLTFTMIGFGLALPFLLLSFFPALQTLLPKPGAWMEKFKIAMGFPMLATAAWLLSQTADHFGAAGPLWVGLFLVLLALALWIYGEFVQRGRKRKGLALVFVMFFAVGGYLVALESELDWRHPPETVADMTTTQGANNPNGIPWQPWSTAAVDAARKQGRPVLVDFTANWCLTCKLNKKTSLEIDSVRQKLEEINAVALLGDYTRKDAAITAELRRFERAGVPLVLVYPKDATLAPRVLPTLLTPDIVLKALDAAAQ